MIRIGIQTEQGFLSFTPGPDGKAVVVEYRPSQGGWETVSLTGLEEAITAIVQQVVGGSGSGTGGGATPTPEGDWLGIPPSQSAEYVAAIKANLQSRGVDLSGPCGAYQVVENVAWGLRGQGIGTFYKDYGNMCTNRSTDVVSYKDLSRGVAIIVDILGDSGGQNNPNWLVKDSEPEDITRWMPAEHPDAHNELTGTRASERRVDVDVDIDPARPPAHKK